MASTSLQELGRRALGAKSQLALASTDVKDSALRAAADAVEKRTEEILEANELDVEAALGAGTSETVVDRLRLSSGRVSSMADGLRQVASLADPVGQVLSGWVRPNGLEITKIRVPLGVVGVIYENRPNVTSDAAGLCIKSGNVAFLRGSSAAVHSNVAIAGALRQGLSEAGLSPDSVLLMEDTSRESAREFMRLRGVIDCLVPRGGPSLIASIIDNATVPYVIDGDGNCHVYVDASADLEMALAILVNGKTQRPSVCNATESLVLHAEVASKFLPRALDAMPKVQVVGDSKARSIDSRIGEATEEDFGREFLDLVLSVAVVDDIGSAIAHVNRYGTGHTEAIVTSDLAAAKRFTHEVDAASVIVNASTRFTDGEQFGFGAEIGISTQKLHARGPMGLAELTTTKYVVMGSGQVRA